MNAALRSAFEQLMSKAPAAIFPKARELYLHKYPLDNREEPSELQLFIKEERIEERIEERVDTQSPESSPARVAVLIIKPINFALVHWQSNEPPKPDLINFYLKERWGLTSQGLQHQSTQWFKSGGHLSLLPAPKELSWQRESILSLLNEQKL